MVWRQTQILLFQMRGDETALPHVSKEKRGARMELKDGVAPSDVVGCSKYICGESFGSGELC